MKDFFWLTNPLPYGLDEKSRKADFWPTPRGAIVSLLEDSPPPNGCTVLDPCAGNGAILLVLAEYGYGIEAIELREEEREDLEELCPTHIDDWLKIA